MSLIIGLCCVQFIPKTNSLVACNSNGVYYSEDLAENWKKVIEEGYYSLRISENGGFLYFSGKNKLMNVDIAILLSK